MLEDIHKSLVSKGCYKCVFLSDFLPSDARKRYNFLQCLEKTGLPFPIMLLTSSSGNNLGNLHFVWKVGSDNSIEQCFQTSQTVIEQTKPQFHTRTMRQALFSKYGRVS